VELKVRALADLGAVETFLAASATLEFVTMRITCRRAVVATDIDGVIEVKWHADTLGVFLDDLFTFRDVFQWLPINVGIVALWVTGISGVQKAFCVEVVRHTTAKDTKSLFELVGALRRQIDATTVQL
jgi:hypothetical protein